MTAYMTGKKRGNRNRVDSRRIPHRKTAQEALARRDLFVMEDEGEIVASAVINQIQVDAYKQAPWKHAAKDNEVMVLHCLTVDPCRNGKGYGKAFVAFMKNMQEA